MKLLIPLLVYLLIAQLAIANTVSIKSVSANAAVINRFEKFELTIDLTSSWKNPFDYDEMTLKCVFVSPLGKRDTVDAFYMQPFEVNYKISSVNINGPARYKVRFTPTIKGVWNYFLIYEDAGKIVTSQPNKFTSSDGSDKGFIRKGSSNYLQYESGTQFIPVGENVNCPDKNVFSDYTNWMNNLSSNGANLMNVWMIVAGFGIEWTGNKDRNFHGLKNYNQVNAFNLDWLLEECKKKNLYISLGLNTCGGINSLVNPSWDENPYNIVNGGPCVQQGEFFKNRTAKQLHKNRLRYILARYGYSTQVMAWSLFIEVDGIDQYKKYKDDVVEWHKEMSNYLKEWDVNKHLVTTSYSYYKEDDRTWKLPNIDFTQTHFYVNSPNPEKTISHGNRTYLEKYDKPTLTAEFGINANDVAFDKIDPSGVHLHNVLWATAFSGAMGPALTYWWANYIHPQNLYYHFKPLSSIINKLPLVREDYKPINARVTSTSTVISIVPSTGWMADSDSIFTINQSGNISPTNDRLAVYLYGRLINTEKRSPAIFKVDFMDEGYFSVEVGDATLLAQLSVAIDNKRAVVSNIKKNRQYTFKVSKGIHTIRVENTGNDWLMVNVYKFSNSGSVLNTYLLLNNAKTKVAGYILNEQYNWKSKLNRETIKKETGQFSIAGMEKGIYSVVFYDPTNANEINRKTINYSDGYLNIPLPVFNWDVAFTVEKQRHD